MMHDSILFLTFHALFFSPGISFSYIGKSENFSAEDKYILFSICLIILNIFCLKLFKLQISFFYISFFINIFKY